MAEHEKSIEDQINEAFAGVSGKGATPVDSLAMAQDEVARTYESHGFTRPEALYMTLGMFTGNPGQAPSVGN